MTTRPDYSHWLRKPAWRLDDAVLLVLGIDPGSYPSPLIRPSGANLRMRRSPPNVFWDFLDVAMKSEGRDLDVLEYSSESVSGTSYANVPLVAFMNWAKHASCKIPDELVHLLDEPEQRQRSGEKKGITPIKEPKRKDYWFNVIHDAIKLFEKDKGCTPSKSELWRAMVASPPGDYGIEYNERKKALKFPGSTPLDRENFNKRYTRYYPDKHH